jgi:hypothetical protein
LKSEIVATEKDNDSTVWNSKIWASWSSPNDQRLFVPKVAE